MFEEGIEVATGSRGKDLLLPLSIHVQWNCTRSGFQQIKGAIPKF